MIDHVVFDIGRVLIHWDPEAPYRRLIADAPARARFLAEVCSPAWNLEQDRGRPWAEAEAEAIARHPDMAELIRAYRRHWRDMVPHAHDDTVVILRDLMARGIDVTMLTNFAPDTFREAEAIYPFLGETRGVTVSGEIGLVKPDRRIYAHHAERFGLVPERTLFIDDSPANVDGARAAGWQALHFTGADRLAADLAARGLTTRSD
ncbi:hydrolase [Aureimonas sp. SA4125]|uniref:HAD family hydrolase n=1 Tax=Aureimonas sp. SA4125 TaxID=2826993 RepID=UPI001CC61A91|nr:HAD family phosphatase [Aureimonas sp. SA4125]BDA83113.1 hydrolase [Aureimonas sp. SA4125]